MGALAFWKAVVQDRSNFLERVIGLLEDNGVRYCVIGGVGVNAFAEPVDTQDLDIIVAVDQLDSTRTLLEQHFRVREFEHSLNVYDPDSGLQVQIQRDPALTPIIDRAKRQEVMDLTLPVAAPRDLVLLKVAAATEPQRRPSKRGKDLLDLARLVSSFPELLDLIPPELRPRVTEMVDPRDDQSDI